VNTLLLHPATLLPVGERKRLSSHNGSESVGNTEPVSPDDADTLFSLPSTLATSRTQDIHQLPSFPENAGDQSAFMSPGSPSPPPSPDLLDNIVLVDGNDMRLPNHEPISAERRLLRELLLSGSAGQRRFSHESITSPVVSGGKQTFPETPTAFSPRSTDSLRVFVVPKPDFPKLRHSAVAKSPRVWNGRLSQRFVAGRSASIKVSMGIKARMKSTRGKRKTMSANNPKVNDTPGQCSSRFPETSSDVATTSKSDEVQLGDDVPIPSRPIASVDSPNPLDPRSPTSARHKHSEPQMVRIPVPPTPLVLPSLTPPDNLRITPPALPARKPSLLSHGHNPNRPARPLGPRAPYRSTSDGCPGSRDGPTLWSSTESLSRLKLMGAQNFMPKHFSTSPSSGPRFQTSPPRFKGLTLEAAKWTLSPEELQAIVSSAVMQSGKVSSIRLLSEQAAFVEVPKELERLTALQNELKVQYRLQVRKRDALLKVACAYSETPEFNSPVVRSKLQELNETMVNLDKLAEELYHARDQAAQLSRMLAVHSGSALTMALRKVHSSFLKRTTEAQNLKEHISFLEAERDEAWAQAQLVARDLDDLNDTLKTHDPSNPTPLSATRRSSRVTVSRKSSNRLSKAGLRLSRGQRASMASQIGSAGRLGYASPVASPASPSMPIPPVPRIPPYRFATMNRTASTPLSGRSHSEHDFIPFY
jgi:hypothetical protein